MEDETEVKTEIKSENEELFITDLILPPFTIDGPPPVLEIKEEEDDLPFPELSSPIENGITSGFGNFEENDLSLGRPKRNPKPKRFYDDWSLATSSRKPYEKISHEVHQNIIVLSKKTVYDTNPTPASKINKKRPVEDAGFGHLPKKSQKLSPKKRINDAHQLPPDIIIPQSTPRIVEAVSLRDVFSSSEYQNMGPKRKETKSIKSNMPLPYSVTKGGKDAPAVKNQSLPQNSNASYKRQTPDDFYRVKFKVKPCYIAIHDILQRLDWNNSIAVNIGACKTCEYLQSKKESTTVKMLEITCKSIHSTSHISLIVNVDGEIFDYVLSQRSYTLFIRAVNLRLNRTLPTRIENEIKIRLPVDFEWKECLPECAYVTPAVRNNVVQTFTCPEKEMVVKTPVVTPFEPTRQSATPDPPKNQSINNTEESSSQNIFKVNKLRCCIHCSRVFRNELTHECPGQVLLVLPPPTLKQNSENKSPKPSQTSEEMLFIHPNTVTKLCETCLGAILPGSEHHCHKNKYTKVDCTFCLTAHSPLTSCAKFKSNCAICLEKLKLDSKHKCNVCDKCNTVIKKGKHLCKTIGEKSEPVRKLCKLCLNPIIMSSGKEDNTQDIPNNIKKDRKRCAVCLGELIKGVKHMCGYCLSCQTTFNVGSKTEFIRCKRCCKKLVPGIQHKCIISNNDNIPIELESEPTENVNIDIQMIPLDKKNEKKATEKTFNVNSLEELYCCLFCQRSYKFEASILRHACVPIDDDACGSCLTSKNYNKHECPGFATCPKCITLVEPINFSRHLCRKLKYCNHCNSVLSGTPNECTIASCYVLNKCKICLATIKRDDGHYCKNLVKCSKCNILFHPKTPHNCTHDTNSPTCKSCNGTISDTNNHICKIKCHKCNTTYEKTNSTHLCPPAKTCEFCNTKYNTKHLHQCTANMCKFCKNIVLFSDIPNHKCYLETLTCVLCKETIPKLNKDVHQCAPQLKECQFCNLPITAEHSCKKCPFCKAIFNKTHICFAKSGKKNVFTHDISSTDIVNTNNDKKSNIPETQNNVKKDEIQNNPKKEETPKKLGKHIYNCESCKMTTKVKTEYLKHTCIKDVYEVFQCSGCPKMFSKREFLEKHQKSMCPQRNALSNTNPEKTEAKLESVISAGTKNNITVQAKPFKNTLESIDLNFKRALRKSKNNNKTQKINKIKKNTKINKTKPKVNKKKVVYISDDQKTKKTEELKVSLDKIDSSFNGLEESRAIQNLSLTNFLDDGISFGDAIEEVTTIDWEELNL